MDGRVKPGQDEWAVTARRANQRFGCPAPFAKIFRFTRRANHLYKFAPSHPTRGAHRDRHGRGVRMRWTRQRFARDGIAGRVDEACERSPSERTRDVAAYGEVVWS